ADGRIGVLPGRVHPDQGHDGTDDQQDSAGVLPAQDVHEVAAAPFGQLAEHGRGRTVLGAGLGGAGSCLGGRGVGAAAAGLGAGLGRILTLGVLPVRVLSTHQSPSVAVVLGLVRAGHVDVDVV